MKIYPSSLLVPLALSSTVVLLAGTDNEALGTSAGGTGNGSRNVSIGDNAGGNLHTQNENTIVGAYAGLLQQNQTGYVGGLSAYTSAPDGIFRGGNTILGFRANSGYTQSEWEAYLANSAENPLPDIDGDGSPGVANNKLSTDFNVFIGYEAGLRAYDVRDSVMIGAFAGNNATTGYSNTLVGTEAGRLLTTATNSTFLGTRAGENTTQGTSNTFLGSKAGQMNTTGASNTYIGKYTGLTGTTAMYNVAVGDSALYRIQNGYDNTAIGNDALGDLTTGAGNTAMGRGAGRDLGTGICNTFVGRNAGTATEYANYNTFVGVLAGADNNRTAATTNANRNTYLGTVAGVTNRDGERNVFIGAFTDMSDWSNATDQQISDSLSLNSDFGYGIEEFRTDYDQNVSKATVVGSDGFVTGDESTALGWSVRNKAPKSVVLGATASIADVSHEEAIVIGYGAQSHGAGLTVIGNNNMIGIEPGGDGVTALGSTSYRFSSATAKTFSAHADAASDAAISFAADNAVANDDKWQLRAANGGAFTIESYASGSYVPVLSADNAGDVTVAGDMNVNSDRRLKQNIQTLEEPFELLSNIDGKTYEWKPELKRDAGRKYGFIAQEVEASIPELVSTDEASGIKSVNYQGFVPVLVSAVKELKEQNSKQQEEIDLLKQQIALQQKMLDKLVSKEDKESNVAR